MSRDLEEGTYYVSQGGKIPVKWTAPEVLSDDMAGVIDDDSMCTIAGSAL